jgi:AraC family transcriptional regulator of adaptative response / DNA-3-methyladenine glycosylase II
MPLDPDACYRALSTHDARFDGRFFVGVTSTRIYCRPVCGVRTPRRENCRFFGSAAAAEVAGFRPCLRCRPELAPGHAGIDAPARLAQAAVELIEDGVLADGGVEELAARIGVTARHLRRVFGDAFGVSPVEYAQTQRLLLAKRLLTDTALPVTEVAYASGFASVRRFNALFRARYRMAPGALRRSREAHAVAGVVSTATARFSRRTVAKTGGPRDGAAGVDRPLVFELAYRPPYDFAAMLGFLGARAIGGVEVVTATAYRRTLAVVARGATHAGVVDVRRASRRHALTVSLSPSLARAVPAALARVRAAFDLGCDPAAVAAALGSLAAARPGLRVPGSCDPFELAVRAVAGQQISVAAARTLLTRLAAAIGTPLADVATGRDTVPPRLFPTAAVLADTPPQALAALGFTSARAATLVALARAVAGGEVVLERSVDVDGTLAALTALPGIGSWTAQYIAMRALRWPDAFPDGDLVVRRALGGARPATAAQARTVAERWRPWRAYAVLHLWTGAAVQAARATPAAPSSSPSPTPE